MQQLSASSPGQRNALGIPNQRRPQSGTYRPPQQASDSALTMLNSTNGGATSQVDPEGAARWVTELGTIFPVVMLQVHDLKDSLRKESNSNTDCKTWFAPEQPDPRRPPACLRWGWSSHCPPGMRPTGWRVKTVSHLRVLVRMGKCFAGGFPACIGVVYIIGTLSRPRSLILCSGGCDTQK